MAMITAEQVAAAYAALASGDRERIRELWAEDMRWLVPGHNQLSGWKSGLEEFLAFMRRVGELTDNSFHMDNLSTTTNEEYSADVTRNQGQRAGTPEKRLDIIVVHVLRWRDGKVVEGRGAIMGDGTTQFDQFWSPV